MKGRRKDQRVAQVSGDTAPLPLQQIPLSNLAPRPHPTISLSSLHQSRLDLGRSTLWVRGARMGELGSSNYINLDLSGIQACPIGPQVSPWRLSAPLSPCPTSRPPPLLPQVQLPFLLNDLWSPEQPRHHRPRAQADGGGQRSLPKAGDIQAKGQRETLLAICSEGLLSPLPAPALSLPPPLPSLPPPRGGGGLGKQTNETENSVPRGGEMRRWDGAAGVDLGLRLRLRLPSTPGRGAAKKAGAAAPAACPVLPLSLPPPRLPRPAPPPGD